MRDGGILAVGICRYLLAFAKETIGEMGKATPFFKEWPFLDGGVFKLFALRVPF